MDRRSPAQPLAVLMLAALAWAPAPMGAQTHAPASEADSLSALEKARDAQARFERFREQRIPPVRPDATVGVRCDELVGRFCLRFARETPGEGLGPADEPVEFGMARTRLMRALRDAARTIPGDRWILGQRVWYLGERGDWDEAEALARECGGGTDWWCTALVALVRHQLGDHIEAEKLFDEALAQMPPDTARAYREPRWELDEEGWKYWTAHAGDAELERRLWLLADPLYLKAGNDRKTAHFARQTILRIRADAVNPFDLEWAEDLSELNVRYGPENGWQRVMGRPGSQQGLQDTRRLVGFFDERSQEFMPPGKALESPADVLPGEWPLEQLKPHTGWVPPYAPELEALETQVARFRRGDSLLVVGAFAPLDPSRKERPPEAMVLRDGGIDVRRERMRSREERQRRAGDPFGGGFAEEPEPFPGTEPAKDPEGEVVSALFLIDEHTHEVHQVRGEGPEGAFKLLAPNGRYVVGIEAWDSIQGKAWRDRHGVWQTPVELGVAAASDLLVLRGDGPEPANLDEAVPQALPAVRIRQGEAFRIAWEMYGLQPGETAQVRIGVDRAREGLLQRAGRFLRLLEPDNPVVMSYEDAAPDVLGTVFRAVRLNLPDLEPGEYILSVEIQLPGREAMRISRTIEVEAQEG
ncbi:MAG: hypothetical protein D6701_10125 [Gemmatimonadetes bacterium]|nr:MAG: hypothetical protein D6701_10125 [Gemmatimonadota bacterium]